MYYKLALLSILLILPPMMFLYATPLSNQDVLENVTTSQIEPNKQEIEVIEKPYESIQDLINRLSTENDFNVNTALRIAECESQYGKYKINWQGSSAKGIYQFTDKTWNNYCEGDVMNDQDNIMCFIKLYKKHPSWWQCK